MLHEYYEQQQQEKNTTEEKMKRVQAAARLIKDDIKSITMTRDVYPSCDDIRSQEAGIEFLPDTLKELLKGLFPGQNTGVKVASIGQAIVQAARPKEDSQGLTIVTYQKLLNIKAQNCCENLDVLWKTSIMFGSPRPAWPGMMQFIHQGDSCHVHAND